MQKITFHIMKPRAADMADQHTSKLVLQLVLLVAGWAPSQQVRAMWQVD
jgi:hypothetical protein